MIGQRPGRARAMARAARWPSALLWLLMGLVLTALAIVVTAPCAIALPWQDRPWLDFCPAPAAPADDAEAAARLVLERQRTETLQDRLRALEVRLAGIDACPVPPPPPPPEEPVEVAEASPLETVPVPDRRPPAPERPPPPPPPPAPPAPPQDIPEEAWEDRDVSFLEGCWNLISDYRLSDIDTGRITRVRSWRMCFDANGGGRQTLIFDNGVRCNAPVRGRFPSRQLLINDLSDVQCDNGSRIFRREIRCDRRADGTAECLSRQPALNNRGSRVIIRR